MYERVFWFCIERVFLCAYICVVAEAIGCREELVKRRQKF